MSAYTNRDTNYILEKKLVCNINIVDITNDNLMSNDLEIIIMCKFQLNKEMNTENSSKKFSCKLVLNRGDNEEWLVNAIELRNDNDKPIFGFSLLDLLEEEERINKDRDNKLTLAIMVKNKSEKFLQKVLEHSSQYIDNAVILDDASENDTVKICKYIFKNIPLTLASNKEHNYYRPFLIRYQPNFTYFWSEKPLHCGRIPENIFYLNGCVCYTRLKHFGWSTKKLREDKYNRYLQLDHEGKYGSLEQYKSILDENPRLIKWE